MGGAKRVMVQPADTLPTLEYPELPPFPSWASTLPEAERKQLEDLAPAVTVERSGSQNGDNMTWHSLPSMNIKLNLLEERQLPGLRDLSGSFERITISQGSIGPELAEALVQNKRTRFLALQYIDINEPQWLGKMDGLENLLLDVDGSIHVPPGTGRILPPSLRVLTFTSSMPHQPAFHGEGSLGGLLRGSSLEMLFVLRPLRDEDLAGLGDIGTLKDITFSQTTHLSDLGLKHLQGLKQLELLNLSGNRALTDAALPALSGFTRLKSLELRDTQITDKGLAELVVRLPHLKLLNLGRTQITDACLPTLAKFKHLSHLYINRTAIGDVDGILALPRLGFLYFNLEQFSAADLDRLQRQRSGLQLWDDSKGPLAWSRSLR